MASLCRHVCPCGLVGFFTAKSTDMRKTSCGGFISERNLNGKDAYQMNTYCCTDEVASKCKVEPKKFCLNIIRKFTIKEERAKEMLYLDDYATAEICSHALTLIAVTKIYWFQTNHHTGQGTPAHFICKAAQAISQEQHLESDRHHAQGWALGQHTPGAERGGDAHRKAH
jgi:hypothetical protein